MKTIFKIILVYILIKANTVYAAECCELQGGFAGTYSEEGYAICKDETVSYDKSCMKPGIKPTPSNAAKKGCTDKDAKNYDRNATIDNGSCILYIYGCTDKNAFNYKEEAEKDDGSCIAKKEGCTNENAINYDKTANVDNKSCLYEAVITRDETIFYKKQYYKSKKVIDGEEKIIQRGKNGVKRVKYKIQMDEDGKESKKIKIGEEMITPAEKEVIHVGSKSSMHDFTVFLYGISTFFCLCNILYYFISKNQLPYFMKTIWEINTSFKILNFLVYIILLLLYILIPVSFIDFFTWIGYEIKKRL